MKTEKLLTVLTTQIEALSEKIEPLGNIST